MLHKHYNILLEAFWIAYWSSDDTDKWMTAFENNNEWDDYAIISETKSLSEKLLN